MGQQLTLAALVACNGISGFNSMLNVFKDRFGMYWKPLQNTNNVSANTVMVAYSS